MTRNLFLFLLAAMLPLSASAQRDYSSYYTNLPVELYITISEALKPTEFSYARGIKMTNVRVNGKEVESLP